MLFDSALLARRVARRLTRWEDHDFLYRQTAENLQDRALDIKRDFADVLAIGWPPSVVTPDLRAAKTMQNVTDLSPPQIANNILPVTPGTFDAVFSHMALHGADDPQTMLQQYFFSLKPDGVLLGVTLGDESLHELRDVLATAETEIYGGVSPRIHPMLQTQSVAALLQQTGFALPVVDTERVTVTYTSLAGLLADLRGVGQSNRLTARRRQPVSKQFWSRAAELYRDRYSDARGRLVVTLDLIHFLGWAPHPSQPQPKRRGSATVQLGDVLKN